MENFILMLLAYIASYLYAIDKVLSLFSKVLDNYIAIKDKVHKIKTHPNGHSDASNDNV
jgi:hypothetical protein